VLGDALALRDAESLVEPSAAFCAGLAAGGAEGRPDVVAGAFEPCAVSFLGFSSGSNGGLAGGGGMRLAVAASFGS
jgi:hypothetical protein